MTDAIDVLPEKYRGVIVEIVGERDPELLAALRSGRDPTMEERETVEDILADAFTEHFGPGHEPTERGKLIDNALGAFLTRWQIGVGELEWSTVFPSNIGTSSSRSSKNAVIERGSARVRREKLPA